MPALESFRTARWIRTANLILQAVLFLTLCMGVNYVASNHVWRKDLTRSRRYSLSPETRGYLAKLTQPVEVVITIDEEADSGSPDPTLPDTLGLLNEYVHATERNPNGRITIRQVDVYRERAVANELQIDRPDLVVFLSGDKRHAITRDELHRTRVRDDGSQVTEFLGESLFTSAILDVSSAERKKIYFLAGNGELRIDDSSPALGLSELARELVLRNYEVATLDLTRDDVPADAALVIDIGAQSVVASIQEKLRQYLDRSPDPGSLIVMLAQGTERPVLRDLLLDWGVSAPDDLVIDESLSTPGGDLVVRYFDPTDPVTQPLAENNLSMVIGPTRSLLAIPGGTPGSRVRAKPVAATSVDAWGETNYRSLRPAAYDAGVDQKGVPNLSPPNALALAIASERIRPGGEIAFSVPSGRLVVVGTRELATNDRLNRQGNLTFALSAVNWAVGRSAQLNLPARVVERFELSLSAQEFNRLRFSTMFAVPGAMALLGLLVYWSRRK